MTVLTEERRVVYVGDGVTTVYPFNFPVPTTSDLYVYIDGVLTVDYTAVLSEDSGEVTFNTPPTDQSNIVIERIIPLTQLADYQPFGPFPAEAHENALDRIVMMVQDINFSVVRSVQVPAGDVNPAPELVAPTDLADRAGKLIGFDDNGNDLVPIAVPAGTVVLNDPLLGLADPSQEFASTEYAVKTYVDNATSGGRQTIWLFNDSVLTADPGAGKIGMNNADPTLVTELYFNSVDNAGYSIDANMPLLITNDTMQLLAVNPLEDMQYNVEGLAVDNTGWWTIPVSHVSGLVLPTDGDQLEAKVLTTGLRNPPKLNKSVMRFVPAAETIWMWRTNVEITLGNVFSGLVPDGGTPSVTFNVSHGPEMDGVLVDIFSADVVDTSTTGNEHIPDQNLVVPAGDVIALRIIGQVDDPTGFHVTVDYTENQ